MILSIGLPTYNRCEYLKDTLDCLLPQLTGYEKEIELIISDNASKDNTKEVVEKAIATYGFPLIYIRKELGVPGEENFITTCDKCRGKYIYLIGDDDIISPNFIDILIPLLKNKENYVAVHWNRMSGDKDCSNNNLEDTIFSGKSIEILNSKDFVNRVMEKPNFMSSIIFRKDMLEIGKPYYKDDYFGFRFFAQMYFGILLSGGTCLYYYFPLVLQRNPSKSWIQFWPQYLIGSTSNIFFDIDSVVPGIYGKWKKKLNPIIPQVLPAIYHYRDYYRNESIKKIMFKHLSPGEKLLYIFYLIPGSYIVYLVVNKLMSYLKR